MKAKTSRGTETWKDGGGGKSGEAKRMCSDARGGLVGRGVKKKKKTDGKARARKSLLREATRYTPVTMTHGGAQANSLSFTIRCSSFILSYLPLRIAPPPYSPP